MARDEFNFVDKVATNNIWITPPEELDLVRRYAPIGLDPCTEPHNPVGAVTFFTEADDGLSCDWSGHGLVFVNPPYSLTADEKTAAKERGEPAIPPIRLWAKKIHAEASRGVAIIALLPCGARFGTGYWQEHILIPELHAVCFARGRIKFINGATGQIGKGNNYDSMFYGFNVEVARFGAVFDARGAVFKMSRHRAGVLDGFV